MSLRMMEMIKDENSDMYFAKLLMQITSNLGQCATSAMLTAQLEQRHVVSKPLKNLEDDSEFEIPGFTLVPWHVYSQCLSNMGLVYLPVNSLSFSPPCHLQGKVASSS